MLVQLVFQPAVLTHTYWPPSSQMLAFCWSGTTGVTNRAPGSQSGLGPPESPVMTWASQVGLTKSANECPPLVEEYIVPSTYSPIQLLALAGSTITSKPSPPAGSAIWLLPALTHRRAVVLQAAPDLGGPADQLPARAS